MSQAAMTLSERADALEEQMMHDLKERVPTRSVLYAMADREVATRRQPPAPKNPGKYFPMGTTSGCPQGRTSRRLIDFYRLRFAARAHLLQSAKHAQRNGCRKRSSSRACSTTSGSSASSAATTATGARRSSSPTWTRK